MLDYSFYQGRTVLVTGHTGFKGTWLCKMLISFGAKVIGYSLEAPTNPNLFSLSKNEEKMVSIIGDVRDYPKLIEVFQKYQPEIVIHLAAQPLVRESYQNPRETYETNVMGTVNLLEATRKVGCVISFLNVTTDKVYLNEDQVNHAFVEEEPLDGFDPYSNSKSCSELVTHSYSKSFFSEKKCRVSTARAGNVIGGGDFSKDRIIPDCLKAAFEGKDIIVRNPFSTRPYQHVLEPLFLYLEICQKQYDDPSYVGYYNVGPDEVDCVSTGTLVDLFCKEWGAGLKWIDQSDNGPHEASFLKLDNKKVKNVFGWMPCWHIDKTVKKIVEFSKILLQNKDEIPSEMEKEIQEFMKGRGSL